MSDRSVDAVVETLYINANHAIEIGFGRALRIADVRDTGIIYQNLYATVPEDFRESGYDFGLISYITGMGRRCPSGAGNFGSYCVGVFRADIKNVDCRPIRSELVCDSAANPAAATGDDRSFAIQTELARASTACGQRETPRFQGMKSS